MYNLTRSAASIDVHRGENEKRRKTHRKRAQKSYLPFIYDISSSCLRVPIKMQFKKQYNKTNKRFCRTILRVCICAQQTDFHGPFYYLTHTRVSIRPRSYQLSSFRGRFTDRCLYTRIIIISLFFYRIYY